jgi:Protein of unknown function (DUF3592)
MSINKILDEMQERVAQRWRRPSWWNLLIVLPWVVGAVLAIHTWTVDRAVAEREQTVLGTITAHEPVHHNRYGYRFSVHGKSYSGWESPRKEEPHIGQRVTVYYDPNDPATNALTDFKDLKGESLGPLPLLLFGVGAVAYVIHWRRRRNPTKPNHQS